MYVRLCVPNIVCTHITQSVYIFMGSHFEFMCYVNLKFFSQKGVIHNSIQRSRKHTPHIHWVDPLRKLQPKKINTQPCINSNKTFVRGNINFK
jgi:hypothetical protein